MLASPDSTSQEYNLKKATSQSALFPLTPGASLSLQFLSRTVLSSSDSDSFRGKLRSGSELHRATSTIHPSIHPSHSLTHNPATHRSPFMVVSDSDRSRATNAVIRLRHPVSTSISHAQTTHLRFLHLGDTYAARPTVSNRPPADGVVLPTLCLLNRSVRARARAG